MGTRNKTSTRPHRTGSLDSSGLTRDYVESGPYRRRGEMPPKRTHKPLRGLVGDDLEPISGLEGPNLSTDLKHAPRVRLVAILDSDRLLIDDRHLPSVRRSEPACSSAQGRGSTGHPVAETPDRTSPRVGEGGSQSRQRAAPSSPMAAMTCPPAPLQDQTALSATTLAWPPRWWTGQTGHTKQST
jgi:hypothetical protein